jgi:hypothetical protein
MLGISGVVSGKVAPVVGGPPGTELHTVVDELPSAESGAVVPVVLATIGVGMVPNAVAGINADAGIIAVDDIVVVDRVIVALLPAMDVEAVPGTVDGVGTRGAVMKGAGGAGTAGGGTGTVVPG